MALTQISTAGVKDDAVTSGKIPANAVGSSEIADQAVTLAKLPHGTSSNDGKFLRANNGADPSFETVNTTTNLGISFYSDSATVTSSNGTNVSITEASSSQAGLMSTTHHDKLDGIAAGATNSPTTTINSNTNDYIVTATGTANTLQGEPELRWQNGNNLFVRAGNGESATLNLIADRGDDFGDGWKIQSEQDENDLTFKSDVSGGNYVDKLKLKSNGNLEVQGDLLMADADKLKLGASNDLQVYHDGSNSYLSNVTGSLNIQGGGGNIQLQAVDGESGLTVKPDAAVELYYNGSKKFETLTSGSQTTGLAKFISGAGSQSSDYNVLHVVAGGTATRGLMIGTGRATGASNNDGSAYFDAIDSESNGYGAQLQFRVDGTKVMVVGYNSNDNVGIGNLYPLKKLTVQADSNTHGLFITHDNDYDSGWGFQADSSSGHLRLDRSINNDFNYRRICFHGDGGIAFQGDTAAANALDDYEEGTWSPSWGADGTAFGITWTQRVGYYVKIGKLVHCSATLTWTAKTGTNYNNTSALTLSLPFNAGNSVRTGVGHMGYNNALDFNGDSRGVHLGSSGSWCYFDRPSQGSGGHSGYVLTQNLSGSGHIRIAFTYQVG